MASANYCSECSDEFQVSDLDSAFLNTLAPVIEGIRYELPHPNHCPECRQQRRISYRNDQNYYHNNCHLCPYLGPYLGPI